MESPYLVAADAILVLHVLFVVFVVIGLAYIYIGNWLSWVSVRNYWFRVLHLAAITTVVVQSWFGAICPLTTWEMELRKLAGATAYEGTFVQYWLHSILYYEAPPWVFILGYTVFGGLVVASWFIVPPKRRARDRMRVVILGNSGSGKSTLASALSRVTGVPTLDLDTIAWEPDQPAVPRDELVACGEVKAFCEANTSWIIEGCYATLIAPALESRPALIFLNPGLEVCLENCRSRPWEPHKYKSKAEQDANLSFLLEWVGDYDKRTGPLSLQSHRACFQSYTGPKKELVSPRVDDRMIQEILEWVIQDPA